MLSPACRFDPQQKSNQTGLRFFSDSQRDEAYLRARPFLLEQKRILLEEDGWICGDRNDSDEVFLDINKSRKKKLNNLILPTTFNHFLDMSKANLWRKIFENSAIFKAERQSTKAETHDLYIGSSRPLSNIFYLLQVLAPGMLVISDQYQTDNGNVTVSRMLPRANWIQRNDGMLSEVMGNTDALTAAKDQSIAFHCEMTTQPRSNTSSQNTDALFAAAKGHPSPSFPEKGRAHKERTKQPRSNTSSQNTDALFAAAKGHPSPAFSEKGRAHKERTKRPRYTSSPGNSGFMNPYISDMDWTACDKDCAWCGRCWG